MLACCSVTKTHTSLGSALRTPIQCHYGVGGSDSDVQRQALTQTVPCSVLVYSIGGESLRKAYAAEVGVLTCGTGTECCTEGVRAAFAKVACIIKDWVKDTFR